MSIAIEQFRADARALSRAVFAARHGNAFLVRSSGDGELESAEDVWGDRTKPHNIRSTQYTIPRLTYEMTKGPDAEFFVYPLKKRRPSGPEAPVTLGRSHKRDVRLDDLSVSNLHAYFLPVKGGFQILDKASRNGTKVGAERLPPGLVQPLEKGTIIEFGRVRTTYMPVDQFIEFVLDVAG